MQISCVFMILGGLSDMIYPSMAEGLLSHHAQFIDISSDNVTPNLILLDHALIRALGGLLIGLGMTGFWLLKSQKTHPNKHAVWAVVIAISIGEGNNAYQMLLIETSFFLFPAFVVVMTLVGGLLYLKNTQGHSYLQHSN